MIRPRNALELCSWSVVEHKVTKQNAVAPSTSRVTQGVEPAEGTQNGILHHVVSLAGATEPPSEPICSVEMRHNLPLESGALVIHRVKTHAEGILFPSRV